MSSSRTSLTVAQGGSIYARRFAARRNHGSSVIDASSALSFESQFTVAELHECLMADNQLSSSLVDVLGGGTDTQMIVDTCTMANNIVATDDLAYAIEAEVNYAQLTDSIIYEPGAQVIRFTGPEADDLTAQYDLVNNASTLSGALGVLQGAPTFVDTANQDYHLVATSLGVDYAPAFSDTDLDGNPRPVDLTCLRNVFGPTDLGAYELQSDPDAIFCNGFETP